VESFQGDFIYCRELIGAIDFQHSYHPASFQLFAGIRIGLWLFRRLIGGSWIKIIGYRFIF